MLPLLLGISIDTGGSMVSRPRSTPMNSNREERQSELRASLTLSLAEGLGPSAFQSLLQRFGSASQAVAASDADLLQSGLRPQQLAGLRTVDPREVEQLMQWGEAEGRQLLAFTDPAYPPQLRAIADSPPVLYVIGDPSLLSGPIVAVVGSRKASHYGALQARRLAAEIAASGLTLVSGLAYGIDVAAQEAALKAGGAVLSVAGHGLDTIYPSSHAAVAAKIAAQGALVSELPPRTKAKPEFFPRRNRIISGLSLGICVIEAALPSGSLITARCAAVQGREVFALPGPVNLPTSRGCHQLLREGASLLEGVDDLLSTLAKRLENWLPPAASAVKGGVEGTGQADQLAAALSSMPAGAHPVIEALSAGALSIEALLDCVDLPPTELAGVLLELEMGALVKQGRDGRYERAN